MIELLGIATVGACVLYLQRRVRQLETFISDIKARDEEGFARLLKEQEEESKLWKRLVDSYDKDLLKLSREE